MMVIHILKCNSTSFYTATGVWRISFIKPEIIKEHNGKIKSNITISNQEKKKLIEYLTLDSKDFKEFPIWDELKYRWNVEKDLMNDFSFSDYADGVADEYYRDINTKGNYIPYNYPMPDYMNL